MKCVVCAAENPAASRFCAACGAELNETPRCEACGRNLPVGAVFCPGCGYHLSRPATILATPDFERQFYAQTRMAFYGRFVERTERKSSESSLYGVVRLLAKRPIEIEMAAALGDLAAVVAEAAKPYVASLRRREVLAELSAALAGSSDELQQALEKLDKLSRSAAKALVDHPLGHTFSGSSSVCSPCIGYLWPGIGTCIGPAVDPSQIASEQKTEADLLLGLNEAFTTFVAAYDRLWLPVFLFVERFVADKCHLMWNRLADFDLDFRRYRTRLADAQANAAAGRLEEALTEARLARSESPNEPLAAILEAQLLYLLGRPLEALGVVEADGGTEPLFTGLRAEKSFWRGRCLFDLERYEETIATFEELVSLPRQRVEARYYLQGEFLLAHAYLLIQDAESGSRRLRDAILGGFTDVAGLLGDTRLAKQRGEDPLRATLRSFFFLQALSRQAGIHPRGSTYLSRNAAPLKLASAPDSWLALEAKEEVVFFYDASRTGSGRTGLLLTDRRLLWKGATGLPQVLFLSDIVSVQVGESELVVNRSLIISDQVFDRLDALHRLLSMIRKVFEG